MAPLWNDVQDVSHDALGRRLGISPDICLKFLAPIRAATGDAALYYDGTIAFVVLGPKPYNRENSVLSIASYDDFVLISGRGMAGGIIPQSSITDRAAVDTYHRTHFHSKVVADSMVEDWIARRLAAAGRPTFRAG